VLWFALPDCTLRCTAQLFDGARVHGLRAAGERGLVAHGGRRVATFRLDRAAAAVHLAAALPSFAAWVLDVRPLRGDDETAEAETPTLLAGAAACDCDCVCSPPHALTTRIASRAERQRSGGVVRRKLHAAVAQRVRRACAALLRSTLWRLASHAAVRLSRFIYSLSIP
jgi:hypothetical protein